VASRARWVIAGAGIGGLTAALTVAGKVSCGPASSRPSGWKDRRRHSALAQRFAHPQLGWACANAWNPMSRLPRAHRGNARSGRVLARAPLGAATSNAMRPYWIVHRGDLQVPC